MLTREVYYTSNNSVLRVMLYTKWERRCWYCEEPKDFGDIQIDHIIPKSITSTDLAAVKLKIDLGTGFEIHGCENLAPICARCNGRRHKSNHVLTRHGLVIDALRRASTLRREVEEGVLRFSDTFDMSAALIGLRGANLNDPGVRDVVLSFVPTLVHRLAPIDASVLNWRRIERLTFQDGFAEIRADESSRLALQVLDKVMCVDSRHYTVDLSEHLIASMASQCRAEYDRIVEVAGSGTANQIRSEHQSVQIDSVGFERKRSGLQFTFGGSVRGEYLGEYADESADSRLVRLFWSGEFEFTEEFPLGVPVEMSGTSFMTWTDVVIDHE